MRVVKSPRLDAEEAAKSKPLTTNGAPTNDSLKTLLALLANALKESGPSGPNSNGSPIDENNGK